MKRINSSGINLRRNPTATSQSYTPQQCVNLSVGKSLFFAQIKIFLLTVTYSHERVKTRKRHVLNLSRCFVHLKSYADTSAIWFVLATVSTRRNRNRTTCTTVGFHVVQAPKWVPFSSTSSTDCTKRCIATSNERCEIRTSQGPGKEGHLLWSTAGSHSTCLPLSQTNFIFL